jgi:hypothetical protein
MSFELRFLNKSPLAEFALELEVLCVHVFVVNSVRLLLEGFATAINHALELDVETIGLRVVDVQSFDVLEEVFLSQLLQPLVAIK